MNRIQLIGQLVSPVEVHRDRITGRSLAKTIIAVPRDVPGTDFVPVTLRDREAIDAARYLGDGSTLAVDAHLHCALLAVRDGHGARLRRQLIYVIADRLTYLDVRPPGGGRP